jgi:hypothetical protein
MNEKKRTFLPVTEPGLQNTESPWTYIKLAFKLVILIYE